MTDVILNYFKKKQLLTLINVVKATHSPARASHRGSDLLGKALLKK